MRRSTVAAQRFAAEESGQFVGASRAQAEPADCQKQSAVPETDAQAI